MQTFNSKFSHFPRTHSFVAHATSAIKEGSIEYWMEEFMDATIIKKCPCGRCYSFTLKASNKLFKGNSCVANFKDTLVVLRNDGEYLDVEIPELSDIPFLDEFNTFETGKSPLNESVKEAHDIVKKWFNQNPQNEPCAVIVD